MKFKNYIIFLSLFPLSLWSQQTYFLSLTELFDRGTKYSLHIKASHIQEIVAIEKEKTARSLCFPEVNIGATAGYVGQPIVFKKGLSHPTYPEIPKWSHNYNLELTQPIYEGGRIKYSIRKAELEKQMAKLSLSNDVADLKLLLFKQYIDLFTLYKQQDVLDRTIEESKIRLKDIRKMKKEGIVTRNDEIRSELQLTNDKLAYREVKDNIYIVSQQLDVVLGLDEDLLLLPDTSLLHAPVQLQNCEFYIKEAHRDYPEIKLARCHTQLAVTDKHITKAEFIPALLLHAGNILSRPISNTMDMFNNNWNVSLSLSYNLSSLYQKKHKMRENQQYINLRKIAEEQLMQDIRVKVRTAYVHHNEALERVNALLLSVKQAEENYRIVHNRYMNQLSILTDLLDATNIRLQEELQLTTARADVIYTYYELLRICGEL